jgi:hypothetical protein
MNHQRAFLPPNLRQAISACERRRRWPHALALLAVLPTADRAVDGVTAACSACGKGGMAHGAAGKMAELSIMMG